MTSAQAPAPVHESASHPQDACAVSERSPRRSARRWMLLLASFLLAGLPRPAFATTTNFVLQDELDQFVSLIESEFGILVGTLIILGCLFKAYWNSQRNQGFGGLAAAVVITFAILNIRSVMDFFFTAQGALM